MPSWLTGLPVAHRGLHDLAAGRPENSLAAMGAAAEAGYAMEFDVRLSGDGEVMVFHDAKLERMTGRKSLVAEMSAAELQKLTLAGTAENIPTFRDLLKAIAGRAPLLIELKNYGNEPVGPLETAVAAALRNYTGPVAVQSFAPGVVEWFREHARELPRGQIATTPGGIRELTSAEAKKLAAELEAGHGEPDFVAYDVRHLPAPLTTRAKAAGKPVLTWTVRSAAEWQRARAHADNLIFENWRPALHE